MSDRSNRFEFALKSVTPADWDRFELLCRSFLASEFDNLRTIAGTNDKGRDGILFECDDPAVVLQYSITEGWRNKIKETVKRLNEKNIPCQILIFCSNQEIGPRADDLKQTLRKEGISLDVRDRTFFVERIDKSQATRKAAEEFSSQVVDGLLPRPEPLTENSPLTEPEMRSALIYLELQMRDVDMQMSLTRLCIESLVLASLADTTREKRKLFNEIVAQVHAQFPAQDGIKLRQLVRQALERLKRVRKATHLTANDSYALHFDERQRLIQTTERSIDDRKQVGRALAQRVAENARLLELDNANASDSDEFMRAIEATFEQLLERQGGDFVSALTGYGPEARRVAVYDEVRTIITARATKLKAIGAILSDLMELATDTVRSVLAEPGPVFQPYLRNLADAYILLAFLRQTPQVDKALGTLFGQGVLVLDTTVILPCFAETLLPPGQRIFTTTLRAAREAGLDVHITRGVLEEVDIHLNNSLNCYRMPPGQWTGQAPFVLRHWQQHAKGGSDFATFVRQFRGPNNPADDIADFLASVSGATLIDLAEPTQNADLATRGQITELWLERRRWLNRGQRDDKDLDILVRHDTEMFFGVLGLREVKKRGLRGHEAWWVTSDTTAFAMPFIAKREGIQLPSRPAMDPGFLSNMLALGPGASKIKPNLRKMLPAALDIQHFGWGIPLISETEAKIRAECEGQPEFVIRRKLRDAADQLRADQRQHERGFAIEDLLIQPE